jgi:hypothetical protein
MALAVNGSGTVFKKCDRSNHRPDSNKGCASSTCQHTCDNPGRCHHAGTLRYRVNGKQAGQSVKDVTHPTTGRVDDGSGQIPEGFNPHSPRPAVAPVRLRVQDLARQTRSRPSRLARYSALSADSSSSSRSLP